MYLYCVMQFFFVEKIYFLFKIEEHLFDILLVSNDLSCNKLIKWNEI